MEIGLWKPLVRMPKPFPKKNWKIKEFLSWFLPSKPSFARSQ